MDLAPRMPPPPLTACSMKRAKRGAARQRSIESHLTPLFFCRRGALRYFAPPHAQGFPPHIRLPDERTRLRTSRPDAHRARLRNDFKREGGGRGAAQYLLGARYGGAKSARQDGIAAPAARQ